MDTPIIYIAGPITGMANDNRPAFDEAARTIKNLGYIVRNPHEFCSDIPKGSKWEVYMRRCLPVLAECTDIIFLPNWKFSRGANLEMYNAKELGINIYFGVQGFMDMLLREAERRAV